MAKRGRHRMGDQTRAFVDTKLSCTEDNRKALRIVSRELVRTRCVDRVVECMGNRQVVVANCPSEGARSHFEGQVATHARALKLAKGG